MSYGVKFSDSGRDQYEDLILRFPWFEDDLRAFIWEVAESPADHGRKVAGGRDWIPGMAAERALEAGDYRMQVTVKFLFDQDENHIIVTDIPISWPT